MSIYYFRYTPFKYLWDVWEEGRHQLHQYFVVVEECWYCWCQVLPWLGWTACWLVSCRTQQTHTCYPASFDGLIYINKNIDFIKLCSPLRKCPLWRSCLIVMSLRDPAAEYPKIQQDRHTSKELIQSYRFFTPGLRSLWIQKINFSAWWPIFH